MGERIGHLWEIVTTLGATTGRGNASKEKAGAHGRIFCRHTKCGRQGGGGGVMGWVIRIIFDPNTGQWGGGGFQGW